MYLLASTCVCVVWPTGAVIRVPLPAVLCQGGALHIPTAPVAVALLLARPGMQRGCGSARMVTWCFSLQAHSWAQLFFTFCLQRLALLLLAAGLQLAQCLSFHSAC